MHRTKTNGLKKAIASIVGLSELTILLSPIIFNTPTLLKIFIRSKNSYYKLRNIAEILTKIMRYNL